MRRFMAAVVLLAVTACGGSAAQGTASGGQAAGSQTPDQVVAEVAGRKITLKELDDRWQSLDPAERARVTQLLYQNRRNVLEQMMGDALIENAAKAAGKTTDQYLKEELPKRTPALTEADVQQFYEANKERAQGQSLEQLRGPIREFLQGQREQQARAILVDELKKKSGNARVLLDPPRQTVEVAAHDPQMGPATAPVTIVEFSDYQ